MRVGGMRFEKRIKAGASPSRQPMASLGSLGLDIYRRGMWFPFHLLVRTAYWVRHPPSKRWLIAASTAIVLAATVVIVERLVGWPEWAKTQRVPRNAVHLQH